MPLHLHPAPSALADLGETGMALAAARLSGHSGECLTCGTALAAAPATIATTGFGDDHVLIRAHHARCDPPADTAATTYVFSPLLVGQMPMLLINPSIEALWLRRQNTGKRNRRGWEDTTATAFTELGFHHGQPGQDLPLRFVPNATVQCATDTITVDLPPVHRWTAPAPATIVAAIRAHGQAAVLLSTGTDHHDLDSDSLGALLAAGDYVAGLADHAPIGRARTRQPHGRLRHPLFLSLSPTVNARTTFLDDPAIAWAATLLDADQPRLAGLDIDRIPVALLETPATIVGDAEADDHLVNAVVSHGLTRISRATRTLSTTAHWRMHYSPGHLDLRGPTGLAVIADTTPDPLWLSGAHGHGFVVVLYGPVLGVRDVEEEGAREHDAAARRRELTAAIDAGLVAAGLVEFTAAASG